MPEEIENFLSLKITEGYSQNTIVSYRRDLESFYDFCHTAKINIISAKPEDITAYMAYLTKKEMSGRTCSRHLSAIKEFYRFLFSENITTANPTDDFDGVKTEKSLPKYLTEEEMLLLIQAAKDMPACPKQVKAVVITELLYGSGMRVSEMAALPMSSVVRASTAIRISGKGKKERLVPLNPNAAAAINDWLIVRAGILKKKTSKWLFPSPKAACGHITRDYIFKILKETAIYAGVPYEKVSPHVLRHSFASHLIAHNADLRSVQEMLGHKNIATTQIYTHIQSDRKKNLVFSVHPLANVSEHNETKDTE